MPGGEALRLRVAKAFLNWKEKYNQACRIMSGMEKTRWLVLFVLCGNVRTGHG